MVLSRRKPRLCTLPATKTGGPGPEDSDNRYGLVETPSQLIPLLQVQAYSQSPKTRADIIKEPRFGSVHPWKSFFRVFVFRGFVFLFCCRWNEYKHENTKAGKPRKEKAMGLTCLALSLLGGKSRDHFRVAPPEHDAKGMRTFEGAKWPNALQAMTPAMQCNAFQPRPKIRVTIPFLEVEDNLSDSESGGSYST